MLVSTPCSAFAFLGTAAYLAGVGKAHTPFIKCHKKIHADKKKKSSVDKLEM